MPPKRRSSSKKKATPPPPPVILYATKKDEFESLVLQFRGSCLVAVVTPFCNRCSRTVMPFLEKLNAERPPLLATQNIVVITAGEESAELCRSLEVVSVPFFFAYSYGKKIHAFSGDNVEKALLIAKIAAQQAEVDAKEAAAENETRAAEEGNVEAAVAVQ
ncbi:uncharacterized protein TM35_000043560 [Trypanosoma theileri]|uniref:Thioredoxin domain-containing protein n=1 Tax=Trypanosoma theileri TaxID=67003 RepID=A0A1X0P5D6_9TRYP|nr:uncharacterized protein TM35_000043560 [Trypanosoma theileri]ORC92142.1 hypothetical protein TM35_000043560 [Trypanosoma theileri]